MNLEVMQYWLNDFSKYLNNDIAIMVCDQAGWHSGKGLYWPKNIVPCYIPAYSPECNPSERLWTWIRERLALTIYEKLDEMIDSVINIVNDWDRYKDSLISMLNYSWWNMVVKPTYK